MLAGILVGCFFKVTTPVTYCILGAVIIIQKVFVVSEGVAQGKAAEEIEHN